MYKPRTTSGQKNIKTLRTSESEQVLSSSYGPINGTEITYTPHADADSVVYEYRIQASKGYSRSFVIW